MSAGDLGWWYRLGQKDGLAPPRTGNKKRRPLIKGAILLVLLAVVAGELRWNWLQAKLFAGISGRLHYRLEAGPSSTFITAPSGPYDQRLGYSLLPSMLAHSKNSFRISYQASSSPGLHNLLRIGSYPIYPEKSGAGLVILDQNREPLFEARYPRQIYSTFESIPPVVVQTLLSIENRGILDAYPNGNPAVEWDRLAKAMGDLAINKVYPAHAVSGGSTLATQLEKLRHSPDGRTPSATEKFRQMMAASLRAYLQGENTTAVRREIVRDYLNSFPLGAIPGYGEVAGLQEGLIAWYGADAVEINRLLNLSPQNAAQTGAQERQALAYRQVLSLMLALNRPRYYLSEDRAALAARTDAYLRILAKNGIVAPSLRDSALTARTNLQARFVAGPDALVGDKGILALRSDLLSTLGISNAYALDRLDLTATSTFAGQIQKDISKELRALANPALAAQAGLSGQGLLGDNNDGSVVFSFTLYERATGANLLRVETDSYDQPLNINRGTRLELGSTAKLRTLVTYLEIVVGLHQQFGSASPAELTSARPAARDSITGWALDYLSSAQDRKLEPMLEAALDRQYSANPGERFYTGGGIHTFTNFDAADNGAVLTVREGFRRSVNLVFIRLMRDVKDYYAARLPGASQQMFVETDRQAYLDRFVDQESRVFLDRFWNKYRGKTTQQALGIAAQKANGNLKRLTTIYRSVYPKASLAELATFLKTSERVAVGEEWVRELYGEYDPQKFNWNDLGYLADMHPLELWLLRFRQEHPDGSFSAALDASKAIRQEVYQWLFRKKNRGGQDLRIGIVLEQDAFQQILASWKRQGYPFANIVPSYASALGSSGDNPAALADFAGIILNEGIRKPVLRTRTLHFAEGTPYETQLEAKTAPEQRVYPKELAQVVNRAMVDVVQNGTARRAYGSLLDGGKAIPIGGKTGTGDNRLETYASNGSVLDSRAVSRTATFVFLVGDRFFGTVTAYVAGPNSANYQFTSALPVQLFRHLAPRLSPLLETGREQERSSGVHELSPVAYGVVSSADSRRRRP